MIITMKQLVPRSSTLIKAHELSRIVTISSLSQPIRRLFGIFLTDSGWIPGVRVVFLTHSCKSCRILYTVDTNQAGSHDLSSSVS